MTNLLLSIKLRSVVPHKRAINMPIGTEYKQ